MSRVSLSRISGTLIVSICSCLCLIIYVLVLLLTVTCAAGNSKLDKARDLLVMTVTS